MLEIFLIHPFPLGFRMSYWNDDLNINEWKWNICVIKCRVCIVIFVIILAWIIKESAVLEKHQYKRREFKGIISCNESQKASCSNELSSLSYFTFNIFSVTLDERTKIWRRFLMYFIRSHHPIVSSFLFREREAFNIPLIFCNR